MAHLPSCSAHWWSWKQLACTTTATLTGWSQRLWRFSQRWRENTWHQQQQIPTLVLLQFFVTSNVTTKIRAHYLIFNSEINFRFGVFTYCNDWQLLTSGPQHRKTWRCNMQKKRRWPACPRGQSDQHHCYSLYGKYSNFQHAKIQYSS